MVASTFQGVMVAVLTVLPGALYTWGFERQVGQWGASLGDRLLRFAGWSALLHATLAPLTFILWDRFVRTGRFEQGDLPVWLWFVTIGYVAAPIAAGEVIGRSARTRGRLGRFVVGPHPSPTAWEHVFFRRELAVIRIRLTSGSYVAGWFTALSDTEKSYASGFPNQPIDLWLVRGVQVDPTTGEFATQADGSLIMLESGILVRYDQIEVLEFIPQEP